MKTIRVATLGVTVGFLSVLHMAATAAGVSDKVDAIRAIPKRYSCQARLEQATAGQYCATLVTNDADTQLATYLTGSLFSGTGELTELISKKEDCLEKINGGFGGCNLAQPFSVRQKASARLTVNPDETVSIAWPGGGVTRDKTSCTANGTFVFSHASYTAVLTLVPCAGPR